MPYHPLLVHFPIVLAVLATPAILFALWLTRKEDVKSSLWFGILVISFGLTASAFVAAHFGEEDEERVERVVSERLIEEHEEYGDMFPWATLAPLALAVVTYRRRNALTKGLLAAASVGVLGLTFVTGHTGAELVYEHGAAAAFAKPGIGGNGSGLYRHETGKADDDD